MLPTGNRLRTVLTRGEFADALLGTDCPAGQGVCDSALTMGKSLIIQPEDTDPADPVIGLLANQEEAVVPLSLTIDKRMLGLLGAAVTPAASRDISFLITTVEQAYQCHRRRSAARQ